MTIDTGVLPRNGGKLLVQRLPRNARMWIFSEPCEQCGRKGHSMTYQVTHYVGDTKHSAQCCLECADAFVNWKGPYGSVLLMRERCATCGKPDLVFDMLPDVGGRLNCHPCVERAHESPMEVPAR